MSREIKFRVWDTAYKKFVPSEYLQLKWDGEVVAVYDRLEDVDNLDENKEAVIMQYTGLKDRNGVEIYESDIIQYDNERYDVYWSEDWAMFTVKGCQTQALMRYASYGEVIGNIYEHPHLLEGRKSE